VAFDERLTEQTRRLLAREAAISEKRMFGGVAFLVSGHMAVAVGSGGLVVRVDAAEAEALVATRRRATSRCGAAACAAGSASARTSSKPTTISGAGFGVASPAPASKKRSQ
jgi:hypothetical protein